VVALASVSPSMVAPDAPAFTTVLPVIWRGWAGARPDYAVVMRAESTTGRISVES